MNFKSLTKGVMAAAMAMSLAACSSSGTAGSTAAGSTGSAASGYTGAGDLTSFTIGTFGPTTGDYAVYGLAVTNGVQLAVKDYNAEHGTDIKVEVADTQGDPTEALNVYNKMVTDTKVAGIIGGTLSGESYAVAIQSTDTYVPMVTPSGTAANITDETDTNVFRACYTDPQQAEQAAIFAYETLGLKSAAIIYDNTSDYSNGLTESFTKTFEEEGGKVLASEAYAAGDVDFSTQLTKIAALDIDVLFIPNYYEDDYKIASQARDLGIDVQFLGCDGWDGVLEPAGSNTDPIEGAIFITQYSPDMDSVQDIKAEYLAEYGTEINQFGVNAYDSTIMMLETIVDCGSLDALTIDAAIAKVEYKGILGNLSFDENGDPIKDAVFVEIKDGAYVTYGK